MVSQKVSRRTRFQSGRVDVVDIVVGVVLLILVPVVCLAVAGMLGLSTRSEKFDFREKPHVDPAPDQEEVDARLRSARQLFLENARGFIAAAESAKTGYAKFFRQWARECLQEADSRLQGIVALIDRYPETKGTFPRHAAEANQIRAEIAKDLEKVNQLDVLKLDSAR